MKKLVSIALAALMVVSMTGCGAKSDGGNAGAGTTAAASTSTAKDGTAAEDGSTSKSNFAAEDGSVGDKSQGKKYIINTDTTFAPFEFENENGEKVGVDLDLLKAIAEVEGFEYELQSVGFSAAVTALESGECDGVIAGMSITNERKAKYDFSEPYYDSGVGMGVPKDSAIDSYEKLKGENVAAKVGTEGCKFAESIADQYGFTVTQFEDSSSMYQDVLAGNSVACFEDYPVLGYEISKGMELKMPLPMETGNSYGFAVLGGENKELLAMFNDGLKKVKESGKYDEILNTYIAK